MPVLNYGRDIMIWNEEERSKIRAVQMDNFRGLLSIRRKDKVPNARIRQLSGVTKGFQMVRPCGKNEERQDC